MLTTPLDWIILAAVILAVGAVVFFSLRAFPNSSLLVFVLGILGMCLMSLMVLLALDVANPDRTGVDAYELQRGVERKSKATALKTKWKDDLTSTGWVDEEKQIARIPLKRALELELVALKDSKPAPAGPVDVVPPAPAPAPTPAPEATEDAPAEAAADGAESNTEAAEDKPSETPAAEGEAPKEEPATEETSS